MELALSVSLTAAGHGQTVWICGQTAGHIFDSVDTIRVSEPALVKPSQAPEPTRRIYIHCRGFSTSTSTVAVATPTELTAQSRDTPRPMGGHAERAYHTVAWKVGCTAAAGHGTASAAQRDRETAYTY